MSILEGLDKTKLPFGYFAGRPPVDPNEFPDRFQVDAPTAPHTVQDTLAYINAVVGNTTPRDFSMDDYITAFAAHSPELQAQDEGLETIVAPGQHGSGKSHPEIISSLAMLMSTDDGRDYTTRAEFLARHLATSQTLLANLNGYGYKGLTPGEPNAAWAVRRALTALGGMPTEYFPTIIPAFVNRLLEALPQHKVALLQMAHDYRYVHPSRPAPVVS